MATAELLKDVLTNIVNDLQKSAAMIEVLESGAKDKRTALELATQKHRSFYDSLRKKIDVLP